MVATIKTDRIETALGKAVELTGQAAAKAWASLSGSGTLSILDSLNVSSATDNGTGDYTLSYTNAMASAVYAWSSGMEAANTTNNLNICRQDSSRQKSATDFPFICGAYQAGGTNNAEDPTVVDVCTTGDLA